METADEEKISDEIIITPFSLRGKKYRIYGYYEDGNEDTVIPFYADKIEWESYSSLYKTDENTVTSDDVKFYYAYKKDNELEYMDIEILSDDVKAIAIKLLLNTNVEYTIGIGNNNSLITSISKSGQDCQIYLKFAQIHS